MVRIETDFVMLMALGGMHPETARKLEHHLDDKHPAGTSPTTIVRVMRHAMDLARRDSEAKLAEARELIVEQEKIIQELDCPV